MPKDIAIWLFTLHLPPNPDSPQLLHPLQIIRLLDPLPSPPSQCRSEFLSNFLRFLPPFPSGTCRVRNRQINTLLLQRDLGPLILNFRFSRRFRC